MVKGRLKFSHHPTIVPERRARMANEYHFQQPSLSNNSFPVTFAISFPVTKVVFISVRGGAMEADMNGRLVNEE